MSLPPYSSGRYYYDTGDPDSAEMVSGQESCLGEINGVIECDCNRVCGHDGGSGSAYHRRDGENDQNEVSFP